jgi:hypothetical protein
MLIGSNTYICVFFNCGKINAGVYWDMKKEYKEPTITSEEIKVGVFGKYGCTSGPIAFINPLFHICCN